MSVSLKNKFNKKKLKQGFLFLVLVILPWLLVIFYTLAVAHPRYVSQSQVVVKQTNDNSMPTGTGLVALLGGVSTSVEDSNYLTSYILSNDMITKLDPTFKFRENFRLDGSDLLNELSENPTKEELLEYFQKRVHVELDQTTHILSIKTQGFTPKYAFELNQALLKHSEAFVNDISQKLAKEQTAFAEKQLEDAEKQMNEAKAAVLDYQNRNAILDPESTARALNSLISGLEANLSSLRTEERQLLSYLNPNAPQVVSLRSQIKAVEQQVAQERAKLTSPTNNRLNSKALQFEQIKAGAAFAEEKYKMALTTLEKATTEANRKKKNLIVISSPFQAEESLYPRHWYIILTSLAFLLIFYGFVQLILAIIRDHRD
ncbi:capsule polysaccharide export inner-membrane protein KpsE [Moraxella macacae 0408225]|uniref:Capsule polysaccharide export inner-membrane protein KpsE n=1 Tax=Moraxella macacae 0408225 TaxID=1230338 RepID=L2FA45_9GAMM|nr:capsule polysaccharide export inner-membrane protein KpsE [Moraxella macacae]ELA09343.1 capsule polysaccharide export inner-membrane protein KpsE [Moraxella macacae 0408225]